MTMTAPCTCVIDLPCTQVCQIKEGRFLLVPKQERARSDMRDVKGLKRKNEREKHTIMHARTHTHTQRRHPTWE